MKQNTTEKKTVPKDVKIGDLLLFAYYSKVENKTANGEHLTLKNIDNGMDFEVHGSQLIETAYPADQFKEETSVNGTEMAELLTKSYNRPFTVTFVKANGEERTLRGRLVSIDTLRGYSLVEDLDIPYTENRFRKIDHRELISFITNGKKYTLKK